MTNESVQLVRDSWALVSGEPRLVAAAFYERLFAIAPAVRPLFAADLSKQLDKFSGMLNWIVKHLDDPKSLVAQVTDLGSRHDGYGVVHDHYALVGDALLWALAERLGDRFTDETRAAWREAYLLLAALMQRPRRLSQS